jgi:hypothetical protein
MGCFHETAVLLVAASLASALDVAGSTEVSAADVVFRCD